MKLSKFRIENQRITNVIFKINEKQVEDDGDYEFNTEITVGKSDTIKNKAKVTLKFEVFKEEDLIRKPYYLQNIIEGIFAWDEDEFDENQIERLLKENAPAVLLSYIRTNTSLITTSAGFKPLVIPLINFKE